MRFEVALEDSHESVVFDVEVTYMGARTRDMPAEVDWKVTSVSVDDGPPVSPVPADVLGRWESRLNQAVAEQAWEERAAGASL